MFDLDLSAAHPFTGYGWDDGFAESFTPYAGQGFVPGRIVRVDRGRVDVVVPDGEGIRTLLADTALVATSDPMRVPCTGDWAVIDPENGLTGDHLDGVVRALLPRRTAFLRSASSKRSEGQILAANVDHAVIAVSLADALDLGRIERFVSLAWESGAQPLVALTKADLAGEPDGLAYLVADAEVRGSRGAGAGGQLGDRGRARCARRGARGGHVRTAGAVRCGQVHAGQCPAR